MYEEGKIRAIGISNFYVDRMVDFASFNKIKPMVNQVETHIYNQQKEMKEGADKYGIQLEAWAPFGEGRGGTFDNPVISELAEKYKKTPAQIMLRWQIQRGIVVIPKSTHIERMEEPELFTAYLQGSSKWDGGYDAVVKSRTPVYLVVGENDEYYGSGPSEEAYEKIHDLYEKEGLSKKEIDDLLVLDVKDSSYFKEAGVTNQHGQGGALFFNDKKVMGWLFDR